MKRNPKALIRKVKWEEVGFQVIGEAENGAEALELVGTPANKVELSSGECHFTTNPKLFFSR